MVKIGGSNPSDGGSNPSARAIIGCVKLVSLMMLMLHIKSILLNMGGVRKWQKFLMKMVLNAQLIKQEVF